MKSKMTMKVLPNCVSMSIHRLIVEGNMKTVLGNTSHASAAKQQSIQSQKQTQPQHKNESDPSAMISPLAWPQWYSLVKELDQDFKDCHLVAFINPISKLESTLHDYGKIKGPRLWITSQCPCKYIL